MKLVSKKEFLEISGHVAYIRYGISNKIEVKTETKGLNSWIYLNLVDFANENSNNQLTINKQLKKLENGESIKNTTFLKESNIKKDMSFLIFELEDFQNIMMPLAECFDKLTKELK